MKRFVFALLALATVSCTHAGPDDPAKIVVPPNSKAAVFSGGCFWCIQPPFDDAKGVLETYVGYAGGSKENPTYEEVSTGDTGYRESIEVFYDPKQITYNQLLDIFWRNINPTQTDGQFYDIGSQYTTAIYYGNDEEKREAIASRDALQKSGKFTDPIATKILPLGKFWPAEEHHQKYSRKNPAHYEAYHEGSGRNSYFQNTWGGK
ncbi:MAG TPA: peptide-methionine (S)-S-oxide reductase MsrA [Chthoniobacteraceae bacterium]|jgi:methionine-S-sulfoxide reductase|nr:peptide-methionine (S)-S-oxide reductase MsrA [Chthoniobacteraceae bacterium]